MDIFHNLRHPRGRNGSNAHAQICRLEEGSCQLQNNGCQVLGRIEPVSAGAVPLLVKDRIVAVERDPEVFQPEVRGQYLALIGHGSR